MMCRCKKPHQRLRGGHPTKRIPRTLVAQPYPRGLGRLLAIALCQSAGWCRSERLNVADSECSKTGSLRAGEASNPSKENRRKQWPPSSPSSALVSTNSCTWSQSAPELVFVVLYVVWRCRHWSFFRCAPKFLADALEVYAGCLYSHGGALSNLRHLILACQSCVPAARPFRSAPWDMVERWKLMIPVNHRTPSLRISHLAFEMVSMGWCYPSCFLRCWALGRSNYSNACVMTWRAPVFGDVFEDFGAPVLRLRSFKSRLRQPQQRCNTWKSWTRWRRSCLQRSPKPCLLMLRFLKWARTSTEKDGTSYWGC